MSIRSTALSMIAMMALPIALLGILPQSEALANDSTPLEAAELAVQGRVNETEPNNSFAAAKTINVGDTVYGQYNASGPDDYFKFNVPNGKSVTITFANDRYHMASSYPFLYFRLYDQHHNQIDRFLIPYTDTAPQSKAFRLSAGIYYLRFEHSNPSNAPKEGHPYHFSVAYSPEMHRLYNPYTGEHFYTANVREKNHLASIGWRYEGIGWTAPATSTKPVYRLYNPYAGDHHYTMKSNEKDSLVRVGWRYEGIGWYSDEHYAVPLYRAYNPHAKTGTHNYTTDLNEQRMLIRAGWRSEGISWYGVS